MSPPLFTIVTKQEPTENGVTVNVPGTVNEPDTVPLVVDGITVTGVEGGDPGPNDTAKTDEGDPVYPEDGTKEKIRDFEFALEAPS